MKVISLSCDSCGAKLDVPGKANFVTCAFCGRRLKIQRGGTAVITEALEELTSEISSLKKDAAIARLDREWEDRREQFKSKRRDQTQTESLPSTAGGIVTIIIGIAWYAFLTGGLSQTPFGESPRGSSGWHIEGGGIGGNEAPSGPFALVGMLGGLAFVGSGIYQIVRAGAYKAEAGKYRDRRRELMGG